MSSSFCSEFQSTCPLRGTTQIPFSLIAIIVFQSTCPLRGTTLTAAMLQKYSKYDFNPRAPCGARHDFLHFIRQNRKFQSTCPLRGTTEEIKISCCGIRISIHVPLAGHDTKSGSDHGKFLNFNPRAPCGARYLVPIQHISHQIFQSTCPLRGTTKMVCDLRWFF